MEGIFQFAIDDRTMSFIFIALLRGTFNPHAESMLVNNCGKQQSQIVDLKSNIDKWNVYHDKLPPIASSTNGKFVR